MAYLAAAALMDPEAAAGPGTLEGRGAMAESAEAANRGTRHMREPQARRLR